jgi:ubiquinone/menaquinone biosynthesis C-methylase UbiE
MVDGVAMDPPGVEYRAEVPGLPREAEAHYRAYDEDERLQRHWLERVRTQAALARWLPESPADVLDIGGGTGIHSRWLVEHGYAVTLVDAMPEHVEQADRVTGVIAVVGDARALDQPDGAADAVLLLGPLYHLVDAGDRASALAEAHRVLRPGGTLFAGAVSYVASLLDGVGQGWITDQAFHAIVEADLATGQHRNPTDDPRWFTTAFFHRPAELRAEVAGAGFVVDELIGVEGPGWIVGEPEGSVEAAILADDHPELAVLSAHLLAVAHRP